jgi:hypothetical protein
MTRSILIVIAVGAFLDIVAGSGCAQGGVGDPCIPEAEYDTCFAGFSQTEVNTESRSFQCQTRLCLVNHFQGRVSCPYGQVAAGMGNLGPCVGGATTDCCSDGTTPTGGGPFTACTATTPCPKEAACTIPGGATVIGSSTNGTAQQYAIEVTVLPQVTPRQASNAVYCSCRCQNAEGMTNDGEVYCACPNGFQCQQLVTQISTGDANLAGGYCIKSGTQYSALDQGEETQCDPVLNPCQ